MSELNIPESWAECDLEMVCDLITCGVAKRPDYVETGIPFLSAKNVNNGKIIWSNYNFISEEMHKKLTKYNKPEVGDLLYTRVGSYGEAAIVDKNLDFSVFVSLTHIKPCKNILLSKFLQFYLNSPRIKVLASQKITGVGVGNLNVGAVRKYDFSLPPIKEQERIVQKIETCFEKIDSTEANLNKAEKLLEKYRESLLAKAFRGELVPQDPNDEPASVLLEKIRKERAQNQKGKKAEQEFAPIADDEKPFDLPAGWVWVNLGELEIITGNTPKQNQDAILDIPFYKPADFSYNEDIFVSSSEDASSSSYTYREVKANSVVVVCIGATLGKTGIVTVDGAFNQQSNAVLPNPYIDSEYLCYWFRSQIFQRMIWKINSSTTMPIVNKSQMENLIFPLCSTKEQKRIVSIIKKKLCTLNGILSSINKKHEIITSNKNSILQKAFEGRLVEQIPSEGTGHELLEKILSEKNIKTEKEAKISKVSKKTSTKSKGNKNGKK